MNLVLLGPPGAGKGTLAKIITDSIGLVHVSTGDILREEISNDTPLGQEAKSYIDGGNLVPDEVVTKLIDNKFKTDEKLDKGFMLDGYPRTEQQAKDLDNILIEAKKTLDVVVYMESTLPVIISRLAGRRICKKCGHVYHVKNRPPKVEGVCDECSGELYQRPDDNEETIKKRMDVYLKSTQPIIEYYKKQNKLVNIDGDKESEDLYSELKTIFENSGTIHKN